MKKFIGDKAFYKMVLLVAVPIMVQNGITNFVNLLDNIMVGQVGTNQMSGVAIVNQLITVFNLCIFGGVSGVGIFTAQYYGSGDEEGVRHTLRLKLMVVAVLVGIWFLVFGIFGDDLIRMFLKGDAQGNDAALTFEYAREYLHIMMGCLIPFALTQTYSGTLRETGETIVPMKAGIVAFFANLLLDYSLIFGKFGFPELGVRGAAIATVIARIAEVAVVMAWAHSHTAEKPFIRGVYRSFHVPMDLVKEVIKKGTPLLLNETLWAGGMAMLVRCYSSRGLVVVAGINIATTLSNMFSIVYIAMGSAIGIILGQLLGAGKMEEAVDTDRKLIFFSVAICLGVAILMIIVSPFFPQIYNTSDDVKYIAAWIIRVLAVCMPLNAFMNSTYFTLRSGGKTIVTFLFDSFYIWVVDIPAAILLINYTDWNVILVYFLVQMMEIVKCIIGYVLVKKGVWLNNMTIKAANS